MLKRTTVYLEDSEVEALKRISFIQSVSMAELIRRGIHALCEPFSQKEKDALSAIAEIKAEAKEAGFTPEMAMKFALEAQKKARQTTLAFLDSDGSALSDEEANEIAVDAVKEVRTERSKKKAP